MCGKTGLEDADGTQDLKWWSEERAAVVEELPPVLQFLHPVNNKIKSHTFL